MKKNTMRALGVLSLSLLALQVSARSHGRRNGSVKKIVVTNTEDCGEGSLRQALEKANRCSNGARIVYCIPKTDCGYDCISKTWVIRPESTLEVTGCDITMNGFSQRGAKRNCNALGKPNNACHKIVIEGPGETCDSFDGIYVAPTAKRFKLLGHVINEYSRSTAVMVKGPEASIRGAVFSADATASTSLPNFEDVCLAGRNGNIGGPLPYETNIFGGTGGIDPVTSSLKGAVTINAPGQTSTNNTFNITGTGTEALNPEATNGMVIKTEEPSTVPDLLSSGDFFAGQTDSAVKSLNSNDVIIEGPTVGTGTDGTPIGGNNGIIIDQETGEANITIKPLEDQNGDNKPPTLSNLDGTAIGAGMNSTAPITSLMVESAKIDQVGNGVAVANTMKTEVMNIEATSVVETSVNLMPDTVPMESAPTVEIVGGSITGGAGTGVVVNNPVVIVAADAISIVGNDMGVLQVAPTSGVLVLGSQADVSGNTCSNTMGVGPLSIFVPCKHT